MVTHDSPTIFNNLSNFIPNININDNVKRILKVNPMSPHHDKHHSSDAHDFQPGSSPVPSIEVVPPSPGSPDRRKSFTDVFAIHKIEINKVLSETLDICKLKLRSFSEPSCAGTKFLSTASSETSSSGFSATANRRMSAPTVVSSQFLLKVPTRSKQRHHRRHSLPVNIRNHAGLQQSSQDDEELSGSPPHHHRLIKAISDENVHSFEKIRHCQNSRGEKQTIHEIFISGYGKSLNDCEALHGSVEKVDINAGTELHRISLGKPPSSSSRNENANLIWHELTTEGTENTTKTHHDNRYTEHKNAPLSSRDLIDLAASELYHNQWKPQRNLPLSSHDVQSSLPLSSRNYQRNIPPSSNDDQRNLPLSTRDVLRNVPLSSQSPGNNQQQDLNVTSHDTLPFEIVKTTMLATKSYHHQQQQYQQQHRNPTEIGSNNGSNNGSCSIHDDVANLTSAIDKRNQTPHTYANRFMSSETRFTQSQRDRDNKDGSSYQGNRNNDSIVDDEFSTRYELTYQGNQNNDCLIDDEFSARYCPLMGGELGENKTTQNDQNCSVLNENIDPNSKDNNTTRATERYGYHSLLLNDSSCCCVKQNKNRLERGNSATAAEAAELNSFTPGLSPVLIGKHLLIEQNIDNTNINNNSNNSNNIISNNKAGTNLQKDYRKISENIEQDSNNNSISWNKKNTNPQQDSTKKFDYRQPPKVQNKHTLKIETNQNTFTDLTTDELLFKSESKDNCTQGHCSYHYSKSRTHSKQEQPIDSLMLIRGRDCQSYETSHRKNDCGYTNHLTSDHLTEQEVNHHYSTHNNAVSTKERTVINNVQERRDNSKGNTETMRTTAISSSSENSSEEISATVINTCIVVDEDGQYSPRTHNIQDFHVNSKEEATHTKNNKQEGDILVLIDDQIQCTQTATHDKLGEVLIDDQTQYTQAATHVDNNGENKPEVVLIDDKTPTTAIATRGSMMSPTKTLSNVLTLLPDVLSAKTNNELLFTLQQAASAATSTRDVLPSKVVYNARTDDINVVTTENSSPVEEDLSSTVVCVDQKQQQQQQQQQPQQQQQQQQQPQQQQKDVKADVCKKDSFESIAEVNEDELSPINTSLNEDELSPINTSLTKASSLTRLDNINKTKKKKVGLRTVSLHEESVNDPELLEKLSSYAADTGNSTMPEEKPTSASMEELDGPDGTKRVPTNKLNRQFANAMMRKAVSLYELQNEKFKENVAKFEQKFLSTEVLSIRDGEDDTEQFFPRISMEDCSTCASCRSRSSSYHSLLYDMDTANRYPIYQPTVCDFIEDAQASDNDNAGQLSEGQTDNGEISTSDVVKEETDAENNKNKAVVLKARKDKFMKQGQAALGSFKERWRRAKAKVQ